MFIAMTSGGWGWHRAIFFKFLLQTQIYEASRDKELWYIIRQSTTSVSAQNCYQPRYKTIRSKWTHTFDHAYLTHVTAISQGSVFITS